MFKSLFTFLTLTFSLVLFAAEAPKKGVDIGAVQSTHATGILILSPKTETTPQDASKIEIFSDYLPAVMNNPPKLVIDPNVDLPTSQGKCPLRVVALSDAWKVNPDSNTANVYLPAGATIPSFEIIITNGTASPNPAKPGESVTITANLPDAHFVFKQWVGTVDVVNANDGQTSFVMPEKEVALTAEYEQFEYSLTVNGGTSDKAFAAQGDTVSITANAPEKSMIFVRWEGDVDFVDPTKAVTQFSMLARDVVVSAVYEVEQIPDPQYNLIANGTYENIELSWQGNEKSYEVWRTDITGKSDYKKIGSTSETSFIDNEVQLQFGEVYEYYIIGKTSKIESTHVYAMLVEAPFVEPTLGCGVVFELPTDAVALNDAIDAFGKPSTLAYYDDPAKPGKVKKVSIVADKNTFNTDVLCLYNKTEIPLFNSQKFNKRSVFAHLLDDSFENGQLERIALRLNVKKATAAKEHKRELRTFVTLYHAAPSIDSIISAASGVVFSNTGLSVTLAEEDYDLTVSGQRFGMKNPKVWVEYIANGRVKKQALKVKPLDEYKKDKRSDLTKSAITDEEGNSDCIVTIPAKKWNNDNAKNKLPEYGSFVLSTGKAFDAVPFQIKK